MSLMKWDPGRDFVTMRELMNRVFDETFARAGSMDERGTARLPIDVYSTENDFVVTASLPGVKAEDVNITVEGDTLTVSGKIGERIENVDYVYSERFHGEFMRTLKLNVPVDADKIVATFEDGVLTLMLPKAEALKPKQIQVKTKK